MSYRLGIPTSRVLRGKQARTLGTLSNPRLDLLQGLSVLTAKLAVRMARLVKQHLKLHSLKFLFELTW